MTFFCYLRLIFIQLTLFFFMLFYIFCLFFPIFIFILTDIHFLFPMPNSYCYLLAYMPFALTNKKRLSTVKAANRHSTLTIHNPQVLYSRISVDSGFFPKRIKNTTKNANPRGKLTNGLIPNPAGKKPNKTDTTATKIA